MNAATAEVRDMDLTALFAASKLWERQLNIDLITGVATREALAVLRLIDILKTAAIYSPEAWSHAEELAKRSKE